MYVCLLVVSNEVQLATMQSRHDTPQRDLEFEDQSKIVVAAPRQTAMKQIRVDAEHINVLGMTAR